jgi:hypothetical protein
MTKRTFDKVFFVLSAFVFIVVVIRAIVVPFCHDETATFFYYIQTGDFLPYTSHLDTNNHTLNSFLAWICLHLFGDSPFSLRLPNILSLVVFMIAVYRLSKNLPLTSSKVILLAGLLASFHWLSFFSVCRGYGISMALMTLAISYVPAYIENKKLVHIITMYLLLDLAISANLMMIIVTLLATALIVLFQLYSRVFLKTGNMIVLLVHASIVFFWANYSFFLQRVLQAGNFTFAGVGTSYWNVTFATLIYTMVGKQNHLINAGIVCTYLAFMLAFLYFVVKAIKQNQIKPLLFTLFLVSMMNGLIIGYYLLKKICGINYPEDRTGMFFYLLFVLNAAFITALLKSHYANVIAGITAIIFTVHFAWNLNFCKHSLDMYDVMPKRFYTRLLEEQKHNPEKITIGGNRFRELFYAFMNYRHNGPLNLMDIPEDPEDMFMYDDYYVAYKVNREKYLPYYREIDTDDNYGFTLLKRRKLLIRRPVFSIGKQEIDVDEKREYFNLFEIKDTTFTNHEPLLMEYNFKVESGDMPALSWLVVAVDSAEGKTAYYKRIPLNWVKRNWLDGENSDMTIETGPLPAKIHRLVCYLWNVKGQRLKVSMNSIKVFQLEGDGSNIEARVKANL